MDDFFKFQGYKRKMVMKEPNLFCENASNLKGDVIF